MLIGEDAGHVIVTFRGTKSVSIAIKNDVLGTISQEPDVAGRVHAGFKERADRIYRPLLTFLRQHLNGRKLIISGVPGARGIWAAATVVNGTGPCRGMQPLLLRTLGRMASVKP